MTSPGDSTRADPGGPGMAFQRAGHPGRVVAEDVDEPEMPPIGCTRGKLRATGQDDPDPETRGHEVDGRVIAAEPGDTVDVDRERRAIGRCPMDERRQVRVADENAGVEARRRVHGMAPVARDEQSRKLNRARLS